MKQIFREKYVGEVREFYESDLVKVLVGIRRCGKSVILTSIMDEIRRKSDNIIYLNFEFAENLMKISNARELIAYVDANRKNEKCYLFLDEIQEVEDWQIAVKDLRLKNCSVFVTGSNSKLLSSEFLSLLSGRFVSFRIRPFVYKEIAQYAKSNGTQFSVQDYLVWGGFPARFEMQSESAKKKYLAELENTVIINDLIKRYKIKKESEFKKIASYVLISNSRTCSIRSIHKYISSQIGEISLSTVARYIEYLKDAFAIEEIPFYSHKTKNELSYYGKLYDEDVAFNSLKVSDNRYDLDHNLENIVYNELLYMNYNVTAFLNGKKEIDFRAEKDGKIYFIQVAYSVVDSKAYEREFSAFADLDNSCQKILVTCDMNDFSTSTVRHIRLEDFLLMESL